MWFRKRTKKEGRNTRRNDFRRDLLVETLDERNMFAGLSTLDASGDGYLSPLDVLMVINHLNQNTALYSPATDANLDGVNSPIDALLGINVLNQNLSIEAPEVTVQNSALTNAEAIPFRVQVTNIPEGATSLMRIQDGQTPSSWHAGEETVLVPDVAEGFFTGELFVRMPAGYGWRYPGIASGRVDRTAPTIEMSNEVIAQSGTATTPVIFTQVTTSDAVDGVRQEDVSFQLTAGQNIVRYSATDAAGNVARFESQVMLSGLQPSAFAVQQMRDNYGLFRTGPGVVADTGLPIDSTRSSGAFQELFITPAPIGFAVSADTDIITGFIQASDAERTLAVTTLGNTLDSLIERIGNRLLLPWQLYDPNSQTIGDYFNTGNFFDNGVMLQGLVSSLGKVEASDFRHSEQGGRIHSQLEFVVNRIRDGLSRLYVPATGQLMANLNVSTNAPEGTGVVDNLGDEARFAIVDLYANGRIPLSAVPELYTRLYTLQNGRVIEVLGSGDGGAFQAFWSSQSTNEHRYGLEDLLYNTALAHLDNARMNDRPGFASAASVHSPNRYDYDGKIGVASLATNPNVLRGDVGALYSVASARQFMPGQIDGFIRDVLNQVPSLNGPFGVYDSSDTSGNVSQYYVGVDTLSYVTGLSGGGIVGADAYYELRNRDAAIAQLYDSIDPLVERATEQLMPSGRDLLDEANYTPDQFGSGGTVSRTGTGGVLFVGNHSFGGWFGGQTQRIDSSEHHSILLRLRVVNFNQSTPIPVDVKLENQRSGGSGVQGNRIWVLNDDWITVEIPINLPEMNVLIFEHLPANVQLEIDQLLYLDRPL